jgi:membrane-bound lytic murein transglycosylase A
MNPAVRRYRLLALLVIGLSLAACVSAPPPRPAHGTPVAWSSLPGWSEDRHAEAWPALLAGCERLRKRAEWKAICEDTELFPEPDDRTARAFFETRFEARVQVNGNGEASGLITGYYEPLLHGSHARTDRFRYPIYRPPADLLIVDLGEVYPELNGKRLRGRLAGRRVVPYFSRAQIDNGHAPLAGNELLWVDDPVGLFFLQIQGSGRVRLPDGRMVMVGYADQNGHPYQSIGRRLIDLGELKREEVNLDRIRAWLAANPERAMEVLNSNPSYVFFTELDASKPGPLGSLNVPLTRERSLAVDPAHVPLGLPVWVDTVLTTASTLEACRDAGPPRATGNTKPASAECAATPYRRLMFAQDTGGAIKGAVRADLFFGFGPEAEQRAGHLKSPGRLYVLVPRPR